MTEEQLNLLIDLIDKKIEEAKFKSTDYYFDRMRLEVELIIINLKNTLQAN
jgi:hypothetical protein